jgi:tetratricopeptide (TPR) repeat protein
MIARDEEHCIADAVNSVAPIADQVALVDTGSNDRTMALAKELGADVREHDWHDDFSAARNESLRHCRGDWIFVLDADEVVAQGDLQRLRELTETRKEVAYRFVTRNYGFNSELAGWVTCDASDPHARGCPGWHPSVKTRLFRNRPEIRFEGRIHELVRNPLDRLGVQRVLCDIPIHHYGRAQSQEKFREKQMYYLSLGRKKVLENPTDAKSLFELGNQMHELGDYDGALKSYRSALEIEPNSPVILANLGSISYKLGDYSGAKEAYERALELEPHRADTLRNLGVALGNLGDNEGAEERLRKAVQLDPSLFDVHRALGVVLEHVGRASEAIIEYRLALERDGPGALTLRGFTRLAVELGKLETAASVLRELQRYHPDDSQITNSLGETAYHAGQLGEAAGLFRRATELDEHLAVAWNNLGVTYVSMDRHKDAVECFRKCLAEDPDNAAAGANLLEFEKNL